MATESGFADWLRQNGFEEYIGTVIEEGGIKDKEGLKADFNEICEILLLSNEKKDKFKSVVFATDVSVADEMQKFCKDCNIAQFKDALTKAGYTDPKMFLSKTEDELDDISKAAGMKLGYLRNFKTAVLEQQKTEFEQWCQNNGFGKFSQELMKHGIKNNRELVSKSHSELDELCKKCSIRLGFARAFQTAVQALQEKSEDKKEEEKGIKVDVAMDIESAITSEDEEESNINVNISKKELQEEKLELKVETTLKDIGVRLSKIQEDHRKHYRPRFKNTLENLSSGKFEEDFQKLKDTLGDMKTQGLCSQSLINRLKEVVVEKDEETKEEEQKKTFNIDGSVNKDAVALVQKNNKNKNDADASQIDDIFANPFGNMLRTVKVDLPMFSDEQKRGRIYKHASGFYDDHQDNALASKPVLNSDHLEKFINFIGGKSTISTESASKISMNDLKHLKIHPVGLFGTKEEVIWQLQILNCISKPIQDMLISEKSEEYLSMGVYAIINLKDAFLKLDKTPKELELMYKSSNMDIVLFFWPDTDSFADIKRGNASSLFLRVLLE
ncbi:hypothetical protein RFI_31163, partial [Reticulomyxa filosa]